MSRLFLIAASAVLIASSQPALASQESEDIQRLVTRYQLAVEANPSSLPNRLEL